MLQVSLGLQRPSNAHLLGSPRSILFWKSRVLVFFPPPWGTEYHLPVGRPGGGGKLLFLALSETTRSPRDVGGKIMMPGLLHTCSWEGSASSHKFRSFTPFTRLEMVPKRVVRRLLGFERAEKSWIGPLYGALSQGYSVLRAKRILPDVMADEDADSEHMTERHNRFSFLCMYIVLLDTTF